MNNDYPPFGRRALYAGELMALFVNGGNIFSACRFRHTERRISDVSVSAHTAQVIDANLDAIERNPNCGPKDQ